MYSNLHLPVSVSDQVTRYCHLHLTADLHRACELHRPVKWDRERAWKGACINHLHTGSKTKLKGKKKKETDQNIMKCLHQNQKFGDAELFFMIQKTLLTWNECLSRTFTLN